MKKMIHLQKRFQKQFLEFILSFFCIFQVLSIFWDPEQMYIEVT